MPKTMDPKHIRRELFILSETVRYRNRQKARSLTPAFQNHAQNQNAILAYPPLLAPVRELYFGGGGGAGRSYAEAIKEAGRFGLDLNKVRVVVGTSVGAIMALGVALDVDVDQYHDVLEKIPADKFQDWQLTDALSNFSHTWGWCKGEYMPKYFQKFIYERTGLIDPTFQELYDAGYKKELRVIATNLDKREITVFSHINTPHQKIADIVALSSSVPFVFPPKYITSADGVRELHTDGGILKNCPFGVGSPFDTPLEEQLGFIIDSAVSQESAPVERDYKIKSFAQYVISILSLIIYQHSLALSDKELSRTVAIRVNHSPIKFTASEEEQRKLNEAGAQGVRTLIHQLIKKQSKVDQVTQERETSFSQPLPPKLR
jgi:predicted acylesterase/phospholipase RssA